MEVIVTHKSTAARISAVSILLFMIVGTVQPVQMARAAAPQQDSTESWGTFSLPAPTLVQLPSTTDLGQRASGQANADPSNPAAATSDHVGIQAPDTMVLFDVRSLVAGPAKQSPNSPAAANNGRDILATYNNQAGLSLDYGSTWFFFDPTALFPAPADGVHSGFSGDQDVLYDPSRDLMLWLMHYDPDANGNNLQLAVSVGTSNLGYYTWYSYQLLPDGFCGAGGNPDWFDLPHMSRTDNFLYIVSDVYRKPADTHTCTTVIRISLDELAAGGGLTTTDNWYYSSSLFNFGAAQGGTDTFYFAAHLDNDTMRVHRWPESVGAPSVTTVDLDHDNYLTGVTYDCTVSGTGVNPCGSLDDRITAGWLRRDLNQLGFMWTAPQGTDDKGSKPFPYIRTLVIDTSSLPLTVADDNWVYSDEHAFFLPSAGVNARGHVGGSYATAGGTTSAWYPQCSVWLYDDIAGSSFGIGANIGVTAGDTNPGSDTWGKYFRTRMSGLNPYQFLGTCYAIEGGTVTPRVVRFGRERDTYLPRRTDFDGEGKGEIGYFHASDGLWGLLQSGQNFSYGSPQFFNWGQTGDIIVPGDYDGDGKSDPTVRRPPTGGQSSAYLVLRSSTGYDYGSALTIPAGWPGLGDTPVPADYNADGITDPGIWRGNSGVWIVPLSPSFTTYKFFSWGMTGDKPVAADVDADGKADIGFFRPSTGVWGFLRSGRGYSYASPLFISWGGSTDTPVVADYDGDGKADIAIVTPPAGAQSAAYRILRSSTGYDYGQTWTIPAGWPALGDTPVPADYDGDEKADAGIWRSSTGVWIIPKSSTNNSSYLFASWGVSGDQPVK